MQLAFPPGAHRAEELVRELAPDDRAELRHLLGPPEPVQPGHQQRRQRCRHHVRWKRTHQLIPVRTLAQRPALEQLPGQLLDVQGYAVRMLENLVGHLLRQRLAAYDAVNEHARILATEAGEPYVRADRPGWLEFQPSGDEHHDGKPRNRLHQQAQQLQRGRVEPVRVLDQHQHRPAHRQPLDARQHGRQRPLLALLRRQPLLGLSVRHRQREKVGQQHDACGRRSAGRLQQRGELGQPLLGRIGAVEGRSPLQLADHGVERGIGLVRRPEILEAVIRPGVPLLLERGDQPRFADPGFSRDEHHLALPGRRPRPALPQRLHLLPATHQLQHSGSAQRVEASGAGALAGHLPHRYRRQGVAQDERLPLLAVEEAADQLAGASGDQHAARRRRRRQVHGETEGLARGRGRVAWLGAGLNQHGPRGDADVGAQGARKVEITDGVDQCKPSPDRALGIVFLRVPVSKVEQHAVAGDPRHHPAEAFGDIGACLVHTVHQGALVLGIEPGRQGCQPADLARQDAQLPALLPRRGAVCIVRRGLECRQRRPFHALHAGGELVPHPRYGEDETRGFRLALDLAPQPRHQHVDAAVVGVMVAPGGDVAQLIARQHPAARLGEGRQQLELCVRKRHLVAARVEKRAALEIQRSPLETQEHLCSRNRFGFPRRPAATPTTPASPELLLPRYLVEIGPLRRPVNISNTTVGKMGAGVIARAPSAGLGCEAGRVERRTLTPLREWQRRASEARRPNRGERGGNRPHCGRDRSPRCGSGAGNCRQLDHL